MSDTNYLRFWQWPVLVSVTFCVILVMGCLSPTPLPQISNENVSVPTAPLTSPLITPVQTLTPVQCPQRNVGIIENKILNNTTGIDANNLLPVKNPEIRINPIPDHYLGDMVTIEGTTNLMPGESITFSISNNAARHCTKYPKGYCDDSVDFCCGGIGMTGSIRQGDCDLNTWSVTVNTSEHRFEADSYTFLVEARNGLAREARLFEILDTPKPDPFHFITFNTPEKLSKGKDIRLSGMVSTVNGPREWLIMQISSAADSDLIFTAELPVSLNKGGYSWNYTLNTSSLSPGNYTVNLTSQTLPKIWNSTEFSV